MPSGSEITVATASGPPARQASPGGAADGLDEIIFHRDLYEVHLLLDFISGRTDKTLDDLELKTTTGETLTGIRVVEAIAKLRYPPEPPPAKFEDVALLLSAKNNLTVLCQPARGLSIAFTAMFVGFGYGDSPAATTGTLRRVANALGMGRLMPGLAEPAQAAHPAAEAARSRAGLAREAFPGLLEPVRRLRWVTIALMYFFFLVWLPLTAITYWDVAFLKATLQPLEQAARDRVALSLANPEVDTRDCPRAGAASGAQGSSRPACLRLATIEARENHARAELATFFNCTDAGCGILHPMRWKIMPLAIAKEADARLDMYAGSVLSVFANNVLPLMFGMLGAFVRMLRLIQYKVRDSLLGPRDLLLTMIGLLIGAVAGFVVGLYLTPSELAANGSAGALVLSASGLGFLAGYGSDHFLQMLDSLLDRVFAGHQTPEAAGAAVAKLEADARAVASKEAAGASRQTR